MQLLYIKDFTKNCHIKLYCQIKLCPHGSKKSVRCHPQSYGLALKALFFEYNTIQYNIILLRKLP